MNLSPLSLDLIYLAAFTMGDVIIFLGGIVLVLAFTDALTMLAQTLRRDT